MRRFWATFFLTVIFANGALEIGASLRGIALSEGPGGTASESQGCQCGCSPDGGPCCCAGHRNPEPAAKPGRGQTPCWSPVSDCAPPSSGGLSQGLVPASSDFRFLSPEGLSRPGAGERNFLAFANDAPPDEASLGPPEPPPQFSRLA